MAKAFGLAGSQAAGTFAAWGTPTVKFHQCRGALSGLMAALLAEQKFVATKRIPHRQGRRPLQHLRQRRKPDAVTADLGRRWELEQIALRLWPSASLTQRHEHRAVRPGRAARAIDSDKVKTVRVIARPDRCSTCTASFPATRRSSSADLGALRRGGDPARPRAHARAVRAGALRRSRRCAGSRSNVWTCGTIPR